MRKAFVVGAVSLVFLVGCNSTTYTSKPQGVCERILKIEEYLACKKSPESFSSATQMISSKVSKKSNIDGEAWIRMGSAIGCQGRGGTFNHNTGQCTLPQQPRIGNVYDNSGRLIGTYVEN
jgi:hypothetical protein